MYCLNSIDELLHSSSKKEEDEKSESGTEKSSNSNALFPKVQAAEVSKQDLDDGIVRKEEDQLSDDVPRKKSSKVGFRDRKVSSVPQTNEQLLSFF